MALAIDIVAGGRAKSAPETQLAVAYLERARDAGRAIGFTSFGLLEADERKADALISACQNAPVLICLDERGAALTSTGFAERLSRLRDDGVPRVLFVIGASDGLPEVLRTRARWTLSFGQQTWPHLLVRAMLAEQVYRAMTIIGGHPYHRA